MASLSQAQGHSGADIMKKALCSVLHTHEQKIFPALSGETSKSTQKQNETAEVNDLHESANPPLKMHF